MERVYGRFDILRRMRTDTINAPVFIEIDGEYYEIYDFTHNGLLADKPMNILRARKIK